MPSSFCLRIVLSLLLLIACLSCEEKPQPVTKGALSPARQEMLTACETCFVQCKNIRFQTKLLSPWAVMHVALAYDRSFKLYQPTGDGISVEDYVLRQQAAFFFSEGNQHITSIKRKRGYFTEEDHSGQWLMILSLADENRDAPILLNNKKYSVSDLIDQELYASNIWTDCSFWLTAFSRYRVTGTWKNKFGEVMSLEKMSQHLLQTQDILEFPCAGFHLLTSLAEYDRLPSAKNKSQIRSFMQQHLLRVKSLQNADGGIRVPKGVEEASSFHLSGHALEWLALVLEDDKLDEEWVRKLVAYINTTCSQIADSSNLDASWQSNSERVGEFCHALHGLQVYHERLLHSKNTVNKHP